MKKLVVMLVALLMTVAANAQFEEGKIVLWCIALKP